MCVSTRERNQFPSVLLQPLGHLSALESMTCERSDRDYRTRRTLPLPFLHCVSFQRFTGREGGHRPGIVSASLSRAITYGDFVALASRLARRTCVSIPGLTWRGGPVDGNGNDCVTATINPARAIGRSNEQGTVERGKLADLLVLDAGPPADIHNIGKVHLVFKGGTPNN
jgi:hypothetical protein